MKSACDWRTPSPRAKIAPAASATERVLLVLQAADAIRYTCIMQVTGKRRRAARACALDIAGDRWTLLIRADLLRGRDTYGKLAASDEASPPISSADRLNRMEQMA